MDYKHSSPGHNIKKVSPKVKLALRALATGAARTNIEAAEMAGVTKEYLSQAKNSQVGKAFMDQQDEMIAQASVNLTGFLRAISAEASVRMVQLMRNASSEQIQFRAAQDLMDRNPEVSKVQKHQVESLSIDNADAQRLAEALVASAMLKEKYAEAANGNFIRVDTAARQIEVPTDDRLGGQGSDG